MDGRPCNPVVFPNPGTPGWSEYDDGPKPPDRGDTTDDDTQRETVSSSDLSTDDEARQREYCRPFYDGLVLNRDVPDVPEDDRG